MYPHPVTYLLKNNPLSRTMPLMAFVAKVCIYLILRANTLKRKSNIGRYIAN